MTEPSKEMAEEDIPAPLWWEDKTNLQKPNKVRPDYAWISFLVVVVAVFSLAIVALANNPSQQPRVNPDGSVRFPPTIDALSAGCRGIKTYPMFRNGFAMVSDGTNPALPYQLNSNTPYYSEESGNSNSLRTKKIEEYTRNLKNGDTYLFYIPSTPPDELRNAADYVKELDNPALRIEVWDEDTTGIWSTKHQWRYVSWGKVQECALFQADAFNEFLDFNPPYSSQTL